MKVRTDIFKTGEMPLNVWCLGFNTSKGRDAPVVMSAVYPRGLGVYVNYKGKPHVLDPQGYLHRSEWPEYWVEMEEEDEEA